MLIPLFLGLRGPQLIIVIVIILLLFGANKIPTIMRNLGKGVHSFRQGIEDAKSEINKEIEKSAPSKSEKEDTKIDIEK